ncbi:MAG: adenylate/guanylate cyclase domain-containing protein [Candidatus Riflebacteria bacterium]|nr:adenylate/guanylate cyclase domain-containing protein [Candidatus Riflebacteria bacterium]
MISANDCTGFLKTRKAFLEAFPFIEKALRFILQAGFSPDDSEDERSRKSLLSLMGLCGFSAGIVLAAHDYAVGFYTKGIPTSIFSLICLLGFIHFALKKSFRLFRFVMLAMILIFPFVVQSLHGGFALAGSSCVWALGCPVCAVMLHGRVRAVRWFLAYAILLFASVIFEPFLISFAPPHSKNTHTWFFAAHIAGISSMIFILVQYFLLRLQTEQEKSEALLLNVLPEAIARRLKKSDETIADKYSEVTILFADLVGFTQMSGGKTPDSVVVLLNKVFSSFDRLSEKYKLEKIKTIGDAYMVVGGLPEKNSNHAEHICNMALEMRSEIQNLAQNTGEPLKIRIGINSGQVVAGVIGIKKFIFDLWGDAVNVASRMESSGIENRIQVTEETRNILCDKFNFTERGFIEIKGKGPMKTYFLEGKIAAAVETVA